MKLADLQFKQRDLAKEMPIITNTTMRIPYSYSKFPKNTPDLIEKTSNNFLDNHLATIEEAYHCKILSPKFLNFFLHQTRKYNHESKFNDSFLKKHVKYSSMNISDVAFLASLNVPAVDGIDLFSTVNNNTEAGNFSGFIFYNQTITTGTVGHLYDQVSISISVANGNIRLGVFSDVSSAADVLQSETGSITNFTDFAFKSLTEYSLPTSLVWIGVQVDNTSNTFNVTNTVTTRQNESHTYGTFPATATPTATGQVMYVKTGHS